MKRIRKALSRPVHPWVAVGSLSALFLAVVLGVPSIALLQTTSYTNAQLDARFVNTTGDYIPGELTVESLCFTALNPADRRCREMWSGEDDAQPASIGSAQPLLQTGNSTFRDKLTVERTNGDTYVIMDPKVEIPLNVKGKLRGISASASAENGFAIEAVGPGGGIQALDSNGKGSDNKKLFAEIATDVYGLTTNGKIKTTGDLTAKLGIFSDATVSNNFAVEKKLTAATADFTTLTVKTDLVADEAVVFRSARAPDAVLTTLSDYPTWSGLMFSNSWSPNSKVPYIASDGSSLEVRTPGVLNVASDGEVTWFGRVGCSSGYTGIQFKGSRRDCKSYSILGDGKSTYVNAGSGGSIAFRNQNTTIATVNNDGFLLSKGKAYKAGGGSWTAPSDARLKDVQGVFGDGLDIIRKLNPVYYRYKSENPLALPSDETFVGLIAQDVQSVMPEAVGLNPLNPEYLTVDPSPIQWAVLNAVKELDIKNQELEKTNEALQRDVNELRHDMAELRALVESGR